MGAHGKICKDLQVDLLFIVVTPDKNLFSCIFLTWHYSEIPL